MGYSKLCRAIVPAAEDNYTHDRAGYQVPNAAVPGGKKRKQYYY